MKKLSILSIFLFLGNFIFADVVINELFYDPDGADSGYEWIELYNNSTENVNLFDWKLAKAGPEFEIVYTFPEIEISGHGFLLIGEAQVSDADIYTSLAFQNGGSSTDGARLISSDGNYTDTVLYDEPNENSLPDDHSAVSSSFAVDVSGGNSLIRYPDGFDTDFCNSDFRETSFLTPRSSNILPIDIGIISGKIVSENNSYDLVLQIKNFSSINVDNSECNIDIFMNDNLLTHSDLVEIPANDSIEFICNLGNLYQGYYVVLSVVNCLYDNELENNELSTSISVGSPFVILNEIMFKPETDNQEWVEIYFRQDVDNLVDNYVIEDASGGKIRFSSSLNAQNYYVICADKIGIQNYYSISDTNRIIESDSWTTLNNGDESLYLKDAYGTILDSLSYSYNNFPTNYSIERDNPYADDDIHWEICQSEIGATPAEENSIILQNSDLKIELKKLINTENMLEHTISIKNVGLEQIMTTNIVCEYRNCNEDNFNQIFSETITLSDSLEYTFSSPVINSEYTIYRYKIEADDDDNSNNIDFSFYNDNFIPYAVNEIMYDPFNGDPEWIELKFNQLIPELEYLSLIIGNDSLCIRNPNQKFLIVTSSEEDAQTMILNYDLAPETVFSGFASLSNSGENITLLDEINNQIEAFAFDPKWNFNQKGTSIERINSNLYPSDNNWGHALNYSTPGKENSLFVTVLPENTTLNIAPNPFSPSRNEHTIISYNLPEAINISTMRIFDLKGRMIRKIADQNYVSSSGNVIWDGKDKNSKNLPVGIYLVKMEATSVHTEKVYRKIKTVIIGK